jgi:hypothetical protein
MLGVGSQRAAIATSRGQVIRLFWLRRRSARIQRRITCNRKLVKPVLGMDTCALDGFTQSQARYQLCRTQAE